MFPGFIDASFQVFPGFEVRYVLAGLVDAHLTGSRVADGTRLAVVVCEGAKPADFDTAAVCQVVRHHLNQRMNGQVDIAAGQLVKLVSHTPDQF